MIGRIQVKYSENLVQSPLRNSIGELYVKTLKSILLWGVITAVGAGAFGVIALSQGETINAVWLLVAAVCVYAVAYRFYSRFIARKVFNLDDNRQTPAHTLNDGKDYVPTNKWVLFGHHFAAIAGPLVGMDFSGTNGVFTRDHLDYCWGSCWGLSKILLFYLLQ